MARNHDGTYHTGKADQGRKPCEEMGLDRRAKSRMEGPVRVADLSSLSPRHCECSEAIHAATKKVWIASSQELLAMTRRQRRLLTLSLRPRRSPTAARGGVRTLPATSKPSKPSIPPHEKKKWLHLRHNPSPRR